MNDVTRYADMKDSGVEWIGQIPSHWKVARLKDVASIFRGGSPRPIEAYLTSDDRGLNWIKIGDTVKGYKYIDKVRQKIHPEGLSKTRMVYKGDLILTNSMSFGEPYILNIDGCIHDGWVCLQNINIEKEFLYYTLVSSLCKEQFQLQVAGGVVKNLNVDKIGTVYIFIPSDKEQLAIVDYLNAQCSQIDEIITEARTGIDEYKKWKASVIYEAVTKGLDPHAEMKDSGVAWIGKIPSHWKIVSLKRLCSVITDGSHFSPETVDNGYPYITATDVRGSGIDYTSTKYISEKDFFILQKQGCQPLKGDVLIVKDGATTGRVGVMIDDTKCVALSSVAFLRPNKNTTTDYLRWLLESEIIQFQIQKSMAGSAMPRTTLTKLVNYLGIICPLLEQQKISSYINYKCSEIDQLINEKEALIADLESYKKSLIYEVVTGKRKII